MSTAAPVENRDTPQGLAYAIAAYVLWGFLPLYMKLLTHVTPFEILAHRIIWSVPLATGLLIWLGRTADIRAALTNWRTILMGALTATLVSLNWGIYVWAITSGQTLEASLGYYINPIFSVFLGAVLLREALTRSQIVAILLALAAVVILTIDAGKLPIVAIGLTLSWGFYAYFKKSLPIGPNQGFLLEVLILLPVALGYVAYLVSIGENNFATGDMYTTVLFIGLGVVTAVPLMIYANGAKLLRLSTTAILQYIAPTIIFLIAVFLFDEPFGKARMIAFPMIWLALVIYSIPVVRQMRRG